MEKSRCEYCQENHKPLRFGTNGLRDDDIRLTDMQIYICTRGFLNYLTKNNLAKKGNNFAIAGDFRPSTPRILIAISAVIIDLGFKVEYFGKIPTPALALISFFNKMPSAMVTASHNPYGQNGVKFMKPDGEVMKEDEKEILEEISKVREEEYMKTWEESMFDETGSFKKFEDLHIIQQFLLYSAKKALKNINNKAKEFYIDRYRKTFGNILEGIRIVFYQQTSVGRDIIPLVLEELGAEVIRVGRIDETREFVPVDTEDMKPFILERMANFAFENNCDICISADGDADRPAVLYLKKGDNGYLYKNNKLDYRFIKGDILNVLVSLLIKPDYVVVPIHLNHRAGLGVLKKNNIQVKLTKIGEPYVIKAMKKIIDSHNGNIKVYGFEANGGSILLNNFDIPQINEISPLAARDALFPVICVFVLAAKNNLSLDELYKIVFSNEYFSHCHSGLVENLIGVSVTLGLERYSSDVGKKIVQLLKPMNEDILEIDFEGNKINFDDGKEEIINKNVVEHLVKIRNILHPYVSEIIEKDYIKIKKINFQDGVKIYLDNEEIIHLRPSGNASQFRIYIESPDEERAMELVEKAVKHNSGTLVKFINDFIDQKIIL